MDERHKITISFLPNDNDLWDFIQHKKETCNISEYIRGLIQQDITNRPLLFDEDMIVDKILQALQNNKVIVPEKNIKETGEIDLLLNDVTKNTILNLF